MPKMKGIWPLPGGSKGYADTLLQILEKANSGLSEDELAAWMEVTYSLTGEKAIGGYIRVIEDELGLLNRAGNRLTLSTEGKRFLETRDFSFLLDLLTARILGFQEVFRILNEGKRLTLKEIYQNLIRLCNVSWEKTSQTLYRLNWLASLGYVDFDGSKYYLTQKGEEFAQKSPPSPKVEPPPTPLEPTAELTHADMTRLMMDLGEIFGFESSESARLGDIVEGLDEELRNRTVDVVWREKYRMIPIEVQAHGSIDSLLQRLEIVEPRSSRLIVVSNNQEFQRIRSYLEFKPRSFREKMVHISPDELGKVKGHIESVRNLRKKIS